MLKGVVLAKRWRNVFSALTLEPNVVDGPQALRVSSLTGQCRPSDWLAPPARRILQLLL